MKIDICTTAYNEEGNIRQFLEDFLYFKKLTPLLGSLILIDNGSSDSTKLVINEYISDDILAVSSEVNRFYGGGMKLSINKSTSDFICLTHSDNQYSFKDIIVVLEKFNSLTGNGQKFLLKGNRINRSDPMMIIILSKFYTLLTRTLIGTKILDVNGMPKVFAKYDFLPTLNELPDNAAFDAALLRKAVTFNYKIIEIDIEYKERFSGTPSWSKRKLQIGIGMLISMIMFRVRN
jgi:glycosyltransferase involved in cell wall biosynthesis